MSDLNDHITGLFTDAKNESVNTQVVETEKIAENSNESKSVVENVKNPEVNENTEANTEVKTEVKADSESVLDKALAKIKELEISNNELKEQSEKWKSFSRKNESSLKELQREIELNGILSEYKLPSDAKDFLKGDSTDELKASAEKLSIIFNSSANIEPKKSFVSKLQGVSGESAQTSPLSQIFKGWD